LWKINRNYAAGLKNFSKFPCCLVYKMTFFGEFPYCRIRVLYRLNERCIRKAIKCRHHINLMVGVLNQWFGLQSIVFCVIVRTCSDTVLLCICNSLTFYEVELCLLWLGDFVLFIYIYIYIYIWSLQIGKSWKFKYLGVILSEDNSHQIDLQERIKNVNKTYFMLQHLFKNKNLSKKLKLRLKNAIIDKMLPYASETWILTKRDRKQMNIFERKMYRRILGLV